MPTKDVNFMKFDDSMKPQIFWEAYARYFLAAKAIDAACKAEGITSPTVLEIGSNGENFLNEFLPEAVVTPLNLTEENVSGNLDNLIVADASNMKGISDNSYDFVISCAVLEHIPPSLHKAVLSEGFRVARIGVFHAAPQESEYVNRAERTVSNFNELLFGTKHRWIEEHLENGHPILKDIVSYCKDLKFDFAIFQHMDCQLWCAFYCLWLECLKYSSQLLGYLNAYYQSELFNRDFGTFNIFMYLYIAKSGPSSNTILTNFKKRSQNADHSFVMEDFYNIQQRITSLMFREDKREIIDRQKQLEEGYSILNENVLKTKREVSQLLNQLFDYNKELNNRLIQQANELKRLNDRYTESSEQYKIWQKEENELQIQLKTEIGSLKEKNTQLEEELKSVKQSKLWKFLHH